MHRVISLLWFRWWLSCRCLYCVLGQPASHQWDKLRVREMLCLSHTREDTLIRLRLFLGASNPLLMHTFCLLWIEFYENLSVKEERKKRKKESSAREGGKRILYFVTSVDHTLIDPRTNTHATTSATAVINFSDPWSQVSILYSGCGWFTLLVAVTLAFPLFLPHNRLLLLPLQLLECLLSFLVNRVSLFLSCNEKRQEKRRAISHGHGWKILACVKKKSHVKRAREGRR